MMWANPAVHADLNCSPAVLCRLQHRPALVNRVPGRFLDKHVRATAGVNRLEGAGQAEAPRGVLHHHYKVDENGKITWANLVIATGQNNNAMNRGVLQAARHYVKDGKFTEGVLNRVEAVVRTFDPCLSCSTHAFGQMPLEISLLSADGEVVDRVARD